MRQCGKKFVVQDRPQMTIWRTRSACWIPKATNAFSQYVILIVFSTAAMFSRTRFTVTFYVHCLYCCVPALCMCVWCTYWYNWQSLMRLGMKVMALVGTTNLSLWSPCEDTFLLSSSSSSPLCRVFILLFLRQTMSLGNTMLQLFCCYYSWCLYR